jgi:hypothetical protein
MRTHRHLPGLQTKCVQQRDHQSQLDDGCHCARGNKKQDHEDLYLGLPKVQLHIILQPRDLLYPECV